MMKKRHILHWAMGVLLTPLLGSCTSDDVIGSAGREEYDIISGQPMTVTSATRATDGRTLSTQFEANEVVWLWANKTNDTEYIKAWQLIANGSGGFSSFTNGADKYWPSDGSHLNVYALHGNFTNSPSILEGTTPWLNLSLTHTVETDQSSDVKKRLSDLLYSDIASVAPNNTMQLAFDHLLAKITVKLDLANSKGINEDELANAEVKLTNILPDATISITSLTANPVQTSTIGTRTTITSGKIPSSITSGDVIGSAIVPLQDFGGGKSTSSDDNVITITLDSPDSRSFSYKPTPYVELTAGNEYIYTLKIINGELSVSSISVNDFTLETTQNESWDIYEES